MKKLKKLILRYGMCESIIFIGCLTILIITCIIVILKIGDNISYDVDIPTYYDGKLFPRINNNNNFWGSK